MPRIEERLTVLRVDPADEYPRRAGLPLRTTRASRFCHVSGGLF
jgi:hypothetical protein